MGLRCCAKPFTSCGERGLLLVAMRVPLIAGLLQSTGSRRAGFSSHGSQAPEHRLSSCVPWAQLLRGMWDPPGPGLEPVSPALACRLSTTVPPGKPQHIHIFESSQLEGSYVGDLLYLFSLPPAAAGTPIEYCLNFFVWPLINFYRLREAKNPGQ